MIDINSFLTCPKCHRMYEQRVTKCEKPCNYQCPEREPVAGDVLPLDPAPYTGPTTTEPTQSEGEIAAIGQNDDNALLEATPLVENTSTTDQPTNG